MVLDCGSVGGLCPWKSDQNPGRWAESCYQHVIHISGANQRQVSILDQRTLINYSLPRGNQKACIVVQNGSKELCPASITKVRTTWFMIVYQTFPLPQSIINLDQCPQSHRRPPRILPLG